MKITIARLRSNVKYNGPLETVLDSFFENYVKWMGANPQHEYDTYNVSFGKDRPKRTPKTIEWADVIVIPSDSEFRYHGELQMNPKDLAKSENHMDIIRPYFEGKTVIMWRSDRGDTEELYRTETLKGVNLKSFHTIDEIDFGIHGMKYHFLQRFHNPIFDMFDIEKNIPPDHGLELWIFNGFGHFFSGSLFRMDFWSRINFRMDFFRMTEVGRILSI